MRVIVADDAVLLREGIVAILTGEGYDVVAAVGSGPDLLNTARAYGPDLVVADVRMPPAHAHDDPSALGLETRALDHPVIETNQNRADRAKPLLDDGVRRECGGYGHE